MNRLKLYGLALIVLAVGGLLPMLTAQETTTTETNNSEPAPLEPVEEMPADVLVGDLTIGELLDILNPPSAVPSEIQDPAFDQYVDLGLLTAAWSNLDASLMTDAALQLQQGERILMRNHKGLSSAELLKMATKLAAENNDKETLARIKRVAQASGNANLQAQINATEKLAASSRSIEASPLAVPVGKLVAEEYADLQEYIVAIRAARLAGDGEGLAALEKDLDVFTGLTEKQKAELKKRISDSKKVVGASGKAGPTAETLNKLNASSRDLFINLRGFGGAIGGNRGTIIVNRNYGGRSGQIGGGQFSRYGSGHYSRYGSGHYSRYGSGHFSRYGSGHYSRYGSGHYSRYGSGHYSRYGSGHYSRYGGGHYSRYGGNYNRGGHFHWGG